MIYESAPADLLYFHPIRSTLYYTCRLEIPRCALAPGSILHFLLSFWITLPLQRLNCFLSLGLCLKIPLGIFFFRDLS